MTLGEIFEKFSIKEISNTTNISEDNIEKIKAEDFSRMVKAKALGFISILEREYDANLTPLREKAIAYYDETFGYEESIGVVAPKDEQKGRSKLFPLIILGLLAYASWYFITQFDKKTLATMIPFSEDIMEKISPMGSQEETPKEKRLSAKHTAVSKEKVADSEAKHISTTPHVQMKTITQNSHTDRVVSVNRNTHTLFRNKKIILLPAKKIWFGIVDMDTKKRDHFTITEQYKIDVSEKSWLIATSQADFALINGNKTQEFNDAKSHYFKVSKEGIEELSRREYVSQGGYKRW